MSDQTFGLLVFLFAFCILAYYVREIWREMVSPEFKRDIAELREQRQRRRAARRRP